MKMSDTTKSFLKAASNIAINSGVSRFFTNIAVHTMPAGTGIITKAITIVGASLLGSMMGDKTYDYTADMVKSIKDGIHIEVAEDNEEEK